MILQALVKYYENLATQGKVPSLGYGRENVSYAINLSENGDVLGCIPKKEKEVRGKIEVDVPVSMEVPERGNKTSGVSSSFLCENSSYLLGITFEKEEDETKREKKEKRVRECFLACKELHLNILQDCKGTAAIAIKRFFEKWEPNEALKNESIKKYFEDLGTNAWIVLMVDGKYVHEDEEVKNAWNKYQQQKERVADMQCLVTGAETSIARLHNVLKGVTGAQAMGVSLVSFNERSFESYGMDTKQGLNAPVSEYAMFAYTTALNQLLSDKTHRQTVGDTTVVYWAENANETVQDWFAALQNPTEDTEELLAGIFQKISSGRAIEEVDITTKFYILGISPNAARASIRFFYSDSFGSIIKNIKKHYDRLEIVKAPYEKQYLSVGTLLAETVNKNAKDKSAVPILAGAVLRSVITGSKYPATLYYQTMIRIKAEQDNKEKHIYKITRGRAAIIKAYLLQQLEKKEDREVLTVALNEESRNKSYVLGRMFAVLEMAQMKANPGINSTIKDRYFTSACATPQVVFPNLIKLFGHHTAKIEYGYARERDLTNLMGKLDVENPFPSQLPLKEQGLFILGYYHQMQSRFEKKN